MYAGKYVTIELIECMIPKISKYWPGDVIDATMLEQESFMESWAVIQAWLRILVMPESLISGDFRQSFRFPWFLLVIQKRN